ncbi:M20 family metallopeptidase [Vulcanisaeta thermophila]|uniref:M20 family metallopeptidase n=1 Tax=Vulcanisaeta thermophila TaxID=867917 RepID=UPI000853653A|nr:M20 family metallopeptidase [Vulcanisaeta thermophila]
MINSLIRKEHVDFAAEVLSRLISIRTEAPPGSHYEEAANYLSELLSGLGLVVKVIRVPDDYVRSNYPQWSGYPRYVVLARTCAGKPIIHFNAHYDVVPGGNGWMLTEPFKPRVVNGRVYGRGASDDKGGVTAVLLMFRFLEELRIDGCAEASFTPDEELGGATGVGYLINNMEVPRYALVAEPTGLDNVWVGSMGVVHLLITCRGIDAHASTPWLGVNAFEDCAIVASEIIRKLKPKVESRRFMNANATVSLGGLVRGGHGYSTVPGYFAFSMDRRLIPTEHVDEAVSEVVEFIDSIKHEVRSKVEVEVVNAVEPGINTQGELAGRLGIIINELLGVKPNVVISRWPVDTRYFQQRGVDAVTYGPGSVSVSHGPDEYVELGDVVRAGLIYALLVKAISEGPGR